ncbi:multiheme c-type cytochrome [Fibrobacterota bacterium]
MHAEEGCVFCHTDSAFTTVYDSSLHGLGNVQCHDCHVESGNVFKFLGKRYLDLLTFSSKNMHSAQRASTDNCLSCHRAVNQFNVVAEDALPEQLKTIGLVVEHQKHSALRDSCLSCHASGKFKDNKVLSLVSHEDPMGCAACHQNVAHSVSEKYARPIPREKDCANCHKKSSPCPSLQKISDIKDENRCTECHPNQYTF